MRPLPASPVFSTAAAAEQGWSRSALRHSVVIGQLFQPRRGYYARTGIKTTEAAARAAGLAYPNGAVSGRSAAALHGLPVVGRSPTRPEMTFQPQTTGNRYAIKQYRASLRPHDVTDVDGVAVTSIARTLADVGRHAPIGTAVAMIDAALRDGLTTVDELDDVVAFQWNWPRIRRAHRALRLADPRAESPLESVSRLVIGWLGLPTPSLQTTIFDQYGRVAGRTDFYWDHFGVVGESDGRSKYDDRSVLVAEKQRQEALEDLGLVVTRWQWELPTRRPHAFRDQLERAFDRGAARKRSGLPRLWSL